MTLTEIPVKQTAKIQGVLVQVVVEVVEDGQAIVINKMVAWDRDTDPRVAHNVIYHVKNVMEAVQMNVMTVRTAQL